DPSGRLTELRIGSAVQLPAPTFLDDDAGALDAGGKQGLEDAVAQLDEYFEGQRCRFDLPLAMKGSPFQRQVWARLQQIPFGTTMSYGQLATELGRPGPAGAVGHANARNPIALIVPCHRVIGSSGSLTGYGGGLGAKQYLLDHEARGRSGRGTDQG